MATTTGKAGPRRSRSPRPQLPQDSPAGRRGHWPQTSPPFHVPPPHGGTPRAVLPSQLSLSSPGDPQTCKTPRSPASRPAQGTGGPPRRPPPHSTHQSCVLPGAFAGPPGRQGCRPPALLRHEPRALRRDSGEGGETRVRSRRRAHGAPQPPRPRRALEGPARGRRVQPPRAPEPGRSWRASAQPPWAAAASGRLQDCGAVARGPALTPARRLPAPRRGYPANNRPPRTKRLLSRRQSPGSGEHPAKGGAGRGGGGVREKKR